MITMNVKRKGNAFEIKIAKEIGIWLFNDKHMLSRHATSGAQKTAYIGDIVPQKQLPSSWKFWPFYIECKNGYKNQVSTLVNQTKVREWLDKCISDVNENQRIILLVINFHGYAPIVIVNSKLNGIFCGLEINHSQKKFFIYDFKEVLTLNYRNAFGWK